MTAQERIEQLIEEDAVLIRLAEEVSLAVLVDPPLLRRARLDLGSAASAGTEADLWFSPLVRTRGPDGFVLDPELAEGLRGRLADDSIRLRRARARVKRAHAHFSPTLRLEEELLWLSTVPGPAAQARAARRLESAVVALVREGRSGIANWAARALPSLPANILNSEPARMLALGASLRFARDASLLAKLPPSAELPGWVAGMLPPDFPQRLVQVRMLTDGIQLDTREENIDGQGHTLHIPDTEPLLLDVFWDDYESGRGSSKVERVALSSGGSKSVAGTVGKGVRLRTIAGETYEFAPSNPEAYGRRPQNHAVYISYARDSGREHALALHHALGGQTSFLDSDGIVAGERFPEALVDALFGARVVVIFAEPRYFTRWYCLLEFRIARTPFLRAVERPGATAREKADALRGLVVALPPRGVDPMMERFPPLVTGRKWPKVDEIERIAELVTAELAANPPTLRERYAAVADADAARSFLLEATRLPPPARIGAIPFVPQVGLPTSIADAFVGRADDLWRIHDLLWTEGGDPATAAGLTGSIEAFGGLGKTRLALEYLYRFGPRHFRGGLFWINAESDAELQLYDVLQALDPTAPAIEQVRQGSGGVPGAVARAIRSRPEDAPTPLFIIDNVPEPEAGQPPKPLETWCPVLGEVPVLTTSRVRVGSGAGGSVLAIAIEAVDHGSAVELLTMGISRDPLDAAEWNEIAEWVGYLPLALEILNRLLRSGEITASALLVVSRAQRPSTVVDGAMQSIRSVVPEGALRGITEAFSTSLNLLTPEEQYAARLIAWMAPAPVPTFVIDAFGSKVFAPGVRSKLRNRSFVAEVRDGSGTFYGAMHRVLADFVRTQSTAWEEEVAAVASLLAELMGSAEGRGAAGSALVRECAPLTLAVFDNWIAGSNAGDDFSQARGFASYAGTTLMQWGYLALASNLFSSLVSVSARWLGEEHPSTLSARSNLAVTLRGRGDLAGAQQLEERVLEARLRILGDEHPDTLTTINNLASTLNDRGDLAGAQKLEERVLEARRRILGDEHPDTLTTMNNLASTLHDRGDLAGAQELAERVLETRRRIFGVEHPETLVAMNNLALTRNDRGDHAGAQELQERVLEARRRILGEEHPATLTAMSNLSATRSKRGDNAGAQELQERVLDAIRRILGEEHPDTLTTMSNLASTRRARGDLAEAQELEERVLEGRRRILGEEHPATLTAMNNLALTWGDRGDHAGAQELQERVLEARRRILGEEHPDTLAALNNLASTRSARGDYAGAQMLQERVLEARRRIRSDYSADRA